MTTGRINQVPMVQAAPHKHKDASPKTDLNMLRRKGPPQQSQNQNQSHINAVPAGQRVFQRDAVGVILCLLSNMKTKEGGAAIHENISRETIHTQPPHPKRDRKRTTRSECHSIGVPCLYSRRQSNKQSYESRR